jgi:hypothetical protein
MEKSFIKRVLDSKETASSKRFITLVIAFHFVVSSFAILFLVCYVAMALPKGNVDPQLLASLHTILEYDFYIILAGLGIITSEGLISMIVNKATGGSISNEEPPPMPPMQ